MNKFDAIDHYCSAIDKTIKEGGAKLTTPRGHEGLTTDMKGRWTIGAFDTSKKNKKETPAMKEAIYDNNAGIMEVFEFFKKASDDEKEAFDTLLNTGREKAAWNLIEKVLGIKFKGSGPWVQKMNDLELLKTLPKEHYTPHEGKWIVVRELIKILEKKKKKRK